MRLPSAPQTPRALWTGDHYEITFPDGVTRAVGAPVEPVVPVPVRFAQPVYHQPVYQQPYGPPYAPPYAPPPPYPPVPDHSPWQNR